MYHHPGNTDAFWHNLKTHRFFNPEGSIKPIRLRIKEVQKPSVLQTYRFFNPGGSIKPIRLRIKEVQKPSVLQTYRFFNLVLPLAGHRFRSLGLSQTKCSCFVYQRFATACTIYKSKEHLFLKRP